MQAQIIRLEDYRRQDFARLYVQCVQSINAYWSSVLSRAECLVLSFVIERTLRWGKSREAIPYRHFLNGVWTKDQILVQARIPIARRRLAPCVDLLEQCGLLTVQRSISTAQGYETNTFEINFKLLLERNVAHLKTPKRLRTLVSPGHKGSDIGTQGVVSARTQHNIHKGKSQNINDKTPPTAAAFGTAREALVASRRKTTAARVKRAAKLENLLTRHTLRAAWQEHMLVYYPTVPVTNLDGKVFASFKQALYLNLVGVDLHVFLDWVVVNWSAMRAGRLSWMNKKQELLPAAPHLEIVCKYLKVFAKAYANEQATVTTTTPRPEAQVQALQEELDQAQQTIKQQAHQNEQLTNTNEKLRLVRTRKPQLVVLAQPVSEATLKEAKALYSAEDEFGEWKE